MTAVVELHVFTGTNAATESGAVSGIDLISADNALNTLGNRQSNPIVAGENSYEKWLKLDITTAPDNALENIRVYTEDVADAETTLMVGTTDTGVTPTDAASSVATTDIETYTEGSPLVWDAGPYTTTGLIDEFLVLQLQTTASASAGNWSQMTITYVYDES